METTNYAIPLNDESKQDGDITFQALKENGTPVTFQLTNSAAGGGDTLDLITSKNSALRHHKFDLKFIGTTATVDVSPGDISTIFMDADGGDWDYVQAQWTIGKMDTPAKSNQYEVQDGKTEDSNGWPPKD
jgi:hypothetical protein